MDQFTSSATLKRFFSLLGYTLTSRKPCTEEKVSV